MDINHPKFSNTISELGISMDDQLVHDQLPFDAIWPIYPLQTHQIPSLSSNQIPTMGVFSNQFNENHHEVRGEGGEGEKEEEEEEQDEELGAMKEMMYKIAAMQPVDIDPATIRKPKRRNVRISDDPQSVAARHRRERISEKIRILQRLVPGGTKLDTASMLDEAIRYVKFLKRQIRQLQLSRNPPSSGVGYFSSVEWPPDLGSTARRLGDHVFDGGSNCELTCFQNEVIN